MVFSHGVIRGAARPCGLTATALVPSPEQPPSPQVLHLDHFSWARHSVNYRKAAPKTNPWPLIVPNNTINYTAKTDGNGYCALDQKRTALVLFSVQHDLETVLWHHEIIMRSAEQSSVIQMYHLLLITSSGGKNALTYASQATSATKD